MWQSHVADQQRKMLGGHRPYASTDVVDREAAELVAAKCGVTDAAAIDRLATATFLATSHRGHVVIAKLMTYALVGIGYALATVTAIAVPWLASKDIGLTLTGNGLPATMLGVSADITIFALVGVGLGALLRNQVAAVVALLVYRFVAEPIVTGIPALADWTIYLPGPASAQPTGHPPPAAAVERPASRGKGGRSTRHVSDARSTVSKQWLDWKVHMTG